MTAVVPKASEAAVMESADGDVVQLHRVRVVWDFPVIFTRQALAPANHHLRDVIVRRESGKRHRVTVFVDAGVAGAHPGLAAALEAYARTHAAHVELTGAPILVTAGEQCKNDPGVTPVLLDALQQRHVDRHSFVLVIGGGAVLDAVGYAAAIFHRGVRLIRMPTTVLAQDDSGVGVKNAINWFGLKNLVGTFAPPWAVVNDGAFLDALPPREKRAGMAEAVKVALIRDADFFAWIEQHAAALAAFEAAPLDELVRRSAALHLRQITQGGDPFEHGSARPLDYGHWSAHKLERLTEHALNHGEAVAIGIALDTRYSVLAGHLPRGEDARVHALLRRLGFQLWHPALDWSSTDGALAVLAGLQDFQEHLGGALTVTLLSAVGRGVEVHAMDAALVAEAVAWLAALDGRHAA